MIKNLLIGFICLSVVISSAMYAWAGNKWMMEKHAQELIQLNENLIGKLHGIENNSKITLGARVVKQDGKTILVIDHLEILSIPEAVPLPIEEGAQYKTFIKYGNIPKEEIIGSENTDLNTKKEE